jgi:transcriptional regulator with XRE-family HTH domain
VGAKAEQSAFITDRRSAGAAWAAVTAECRDRWGMNARQVLRLGRRLSQREVADEWCRRWPEDPKTFKNVSTWERWPASGHEPSLQVLDRLAQIYRCSIADLVCDLGDYGFQFAAAPGEDSGVDRRTLLAGLASTAAVASTRHLPSPTTTLGPDALGFYAAQLRSHWQADRTLGPSILLGTVIPQATAVLAAVEQTRGADHRQCLELATAYTGFLGWLFQDSGDMTQCGNWLSRTLELAHRAADPPLVAYALTSKAMVCVDLGDGQGAVELAGAAISSAPELAPKAQVMALQHAAHGHALLGNRSEVDRLLDEMHATLDQMAADDHPWGGDRLHRSPTDVVDTQRATCYGRLNLGAQAAGLWARLRRSWRAEERRDTGIHSSRHIAALLDAGEPAEAARFAADDVELLMQTSSARMRRELAQLHDRAMQWSTSRPGRDLLDTLAAITN